ncbi:hypothetical protein PPL_01207 [Heterostelium album PN500]|uniref:Uncharacterized protein n=1 Tax=Heterostelium pallidum (strain ATCC 26659 / Pp 5 / PN500) TaxID=670386 RepID=D3AYE7_HETP5|nr:hypothetical protein PPL_01207 [Heterostelium album PN500]EFA85974.1 hypothetical protein PPL_01207 [Heterostelium album PN500]|eukprot:XP_020438080.1 hypothetical protein PPL_01207 [Heterostelium album PN500]
MSFDYILSYSLHSSSSSDRGNNKKMNRYFNLLPLFVFLMILCLYIASYQVYWFRIFWGGGNKTYFYYNDFKNINSTMSSVESFDNMEKTLSLLQLCIALMTLSLVCVVVIILLHSILLLGFKKSSSLVPRTSRLFSVASFISVSVSIIYFTRIMHTIEDDCKAKSDKIPLRCDLLPDDKGFIRKNSNSTSDSFAEPTLETVGWQPYTGWVVITICGFLNLIGIIIVWVITLRKEKRRKYKPIDDEQMLIWNTPI